MSGGGDAMNATKVLDLGLAQPKQAEFFDSRTFYTAFGGA